MSRYDSDYDDDDQSVGDYEMNGPDRLSWSDLQAMENEEPDSSDPRPRCPDCGEPGERPGHMGCQYPQDR